MSQLNDQNPGMEKNLDKLFRDAIGNQEVTPSPKVWKNLNFKLLIKELLHFNFTNVPRLAFVTAAGSLVVVASLTYWISNGSDSSPVPARDIPSNPAVKSTAIQGLVKSAEVKQPALTASSNSNIASGTSASSSISRATKTNSLPSSAGAAPVKIMASNTKPLIRTIPEDAAMQSAAEPETPALPTVVKETAGADKGSLFAVDPLNSLGFNGFITAEDTLTFIRNGEVFKYVRDKIPPTSFFSVNLGVAPEMSVYHSDGTSTVQGNYWLNAGFAYHFSRFSVRTGLGIGYTYDDGKYVVNYRSNDSVSYYRKVIGYIQDPANPGHIIYIIRNQAIYDSVNHIADDRTRDRYTYIQVPLLLGYTVYETPRFRLGFEIGPAVNFLVGSKKADLYVDIPNGRLIKLEDDTPARVFTNWQVWVDLTLEYQFTRNWGLSINPYYKYFITNPYQSAESGTPTSQSFGLDIGIQYFFGRKVIKK